MGAVRERGSTISRSARYVYLRFVRLRGSAKEVARGMALGVFIGMTPTMGIQMPLALFLAMIFRENKFAAIIGVWVSNPMTAIPIYTFNFKVGQYLLGTKELKIPNFSSINQMLELGHDFFLPLLFGCIVIGIISAIAAYFITLYVYSFIQMEKEMIARKKEEKARRREAEKKG